MLHHQHKVPAVIILGLQQCPLTNWSEHIQIKPMKEMAYSKHASTKQENFEQIKCTLNSHW